MNDDIGFKVPIHQSCLEPVLIAGIPRAACIFLWSAIGALVLGLRQPWVIPIGLALHFLLREVAKHDPYFFDVIKGALKMPKRLEP